MPFLGGMRSPVTHLDANASIENLINVRSTLFTYWQTTNKKPLYLVVSSCYISRYGKSTSKENPGWPCNLDCDEAYKVHAIRP